MSDSVAQSSVAATVVATAPMITPVAASPVDGSVQVDVTAQRPASGSSFHQLLSEMNPLQYIPVVGSVYRAMTGDTVPDSVRQLGSMVVSGLVGGPVGVAMNAGFLLAEQITGIDPEAIEQEVLGAIGIGPGHVAVAKAQTTPKVTAVVTDSDPVPGNGTDSGMDVVPAVAPSGTPASATPMVPSSAGAVSPAGAASSVAPASSTGLSASVGSSAKSAAARAKAALAPAAPWTPAQLSAYGVSKTPSGEFKRGKLEGADVLNDIELASIGDTYAGDPAPAGAAAKAAT